MATYALSAQYYAGAVGSVELPEGKTWEDIEEWYVKWDVLHFKLKEEEAWKEVELGFGAVDIVDWKHPISIGVYGTTDDNEINWNNLIEELE